MKRAFDNRWALAALLLLAALATIGGESDAEEPAIAAPPVTATEDADGSLEDAPAGQAGVRIYLDPETGELRTRPSEDEELGEVQRFDPAERFSRYSRDLLQEPIPQGGFKVDLRGRFQSAVVATIDPETDTVTIDCVAGDHAEDPAHE